MTSEPVGSVVLRLFAAAREAAGRGRDEFDGHDVGEVLDAACTRYGETFSAVLATSRVWVNGSPAERGDRVAPGDEVAVLPPVSGGCA
jgi:sulfur-carrier protein